MNNNIIDLGDLRTKTLTFKISGDTFLLKTSEDTLLAELKAVKELKPEVDTFTKKFSDYFNDKKNRLEFDDIKSGFASLKVEILDLLSDMFEGDKAETSKKLKAATSDSLIKLAQVFSAVDGALDREQGQVKDKKANYYKKR